MLQLNFMFKKNVVQAPEFQYYFLYKLFYFGAEYMNCQKFYFENWFSWAFYIRTSNEINKIFWLVKNTYR